MNDPILSFSNVNNAYGKIKVLHDITLHLYPGEIVTLLGANGSGKSTLIKSIFSQPRITSGEIHFFSKPIQHYNTCDIAKQGIALVPEGRHVFEQMSVQENCLMGAWNRKDNQINQTLDFVYHVFPQLTHRRTQLAGTLSGGEQQMLAIARALMSQPKLLILDEPSLGLAPQLTKKIFLTLSSIVMKNKLSILLVEQNVKAALNMANRGYILSNGKIQFSGTSQKLSDNTLIKNVYLGLTH